MQRLRLSSFVLFSSFSSLFLRPSHCIPSPLISRSLNGFSPAAFFPSPQGSPQQFHTKHSNNIYYYDNNSNHPLMSPLISSLSSSGYRADDLRPQQTQQATDLVSLEALERLGSVETGSYLKDPLGFQQPEHEQITPENGVNDEILMDSFDLLKKQIERVKEEEDIELKSELLEKLLLEYPEGPLPVIYVEETTPEEDLVVDKRSGRYYRRYPWKRQQKGKGSSYDPDARYMCTPTRDEIFRLLVGLHETHKGNQRRQVNFCNRKRPAKAIFTNIRFLG